MFQSNLFRMVQIMATSGASEDIAIAGGKNNNCFLHCLIHSIFSAPPEVQASIMQRPAMQELLEEFKRYYNLERVPTAEDVAAINAQYPHPWDRETIWGSVFRQYLLRGDGLVTEKELDSVTGTQPIYDDIGARLANALGISINLHPSESDDPGFILSTPAENHLFAIEIFHRPPAKEGHYDFKYPNDADGAKSRAHNASYENVEVRTPVSGRASLDSDEVVDAVIKTKHRTPLDSELYDVLEAEVGDNEADRIEMVKAFVQSMIKPSTSIPVVPSSSEVDVDEEARRDRQIEEDASVVMRRQSRSPNASATAANEDSVEHTATTSPTTPRRDKRGNRGPGVMFIDRQEDLAARQRTEAKASGVLTDSEAETKRDEIFELRGRAAPTSKGTTEELPKIPIDEATGFPKAFIEKLPELFPDEHWNRDLKKDDLNITHKTEENRSIQIKQEPEKDKPEVTFTGNNLSDLASCANAYQDSVKQAYDIEYELSVSSLDQAKTFMREMKAKGMDVSALTNLKVNGKAVAKEELDAMIKEIQPPKEPPRPTSSGGGMSRGR